MIAALATFLGAAMLKAIVHQRNYPVGREHSPVCSQG